MRTSRSREEIKIKYRYYYCYYYCRCNVGRYLKKNIICVIHEQKGCVEDSGGG